MSFTRAKIIGGELYRHLKYVTLRGRVREDETFVVYGCNVRDEKIFYEGLLEHDKETGILGFETVDEVEEFWMEGGLSLVLDKYSYMVLKGE